MPGKSTGELMAELDAFPLPVGYHIEYVDMSYQERQNQGKIGLLIALALTFGYLFLVAQYESWTIPVPVMGRGNFKKPKMLQQPKSQKIKLTKIIRVQTVSLQAQ